MSTRLYHQITMTDGTTLLLQRALGGPLDFEVRWKEDPQGRPIPYTLELLMTFSDHLEEGWIYGWRSIAEMQSMLTSSDVLAVSYQIWASLTQKTLRGGTDPERCLRNFNRERNICSQLGALDWQSSSHGMFTA